MGDAAPARPPGGPRKLEALQGRGAWPDGEASLTLRVVKLSPEGAAVAEYPGAIVPGGAPAPWLCVRAVWGHGVVALDGLEFRPGDELLEYFSPTAWFNVFAVYAPEGALRGWYANVTYPAAFDPTTDPPTLCWRDLYLDVIALPDGRRALRDEDELRDAGIAEREPELYERILAGRAAILRRLDAGAFPFDRRRA